MSRRASMVLSGEIKLVRLYSHCEQCGKWQYNNQPEGWYVNDTTNKWQDTCAQMQGSSSEEIGGNGVFDSIWGIEHKHTRHEHMHDMYVSIWAGYTTTILTIALLVNQLTWCNDIIKSTTWKIYGYIQFIHQFFHLHISILYYTFIFIYRYEIFLMPS